MIYDGDSVRPGCGDVSGGPLEKKEHRETAVMWISSGDTHGKGTLEPADGCCDVVGRDGTPSLLLIGVEDVTLRVDDQDAALKVAFADEVAVDLLVLYASADVANAAIKAEGIEEGAGGRRQRDELSIPEEFVEDAGVVEEEAPTGEIVRFEGTDAQDGIVGGLCRRRYFFDDADEVRRRRRRPIDVDEVAGLLAAQLSARSTHDEDDGPRVGPQGRRWHERADDAAAGDGADLGPSKAARRHQNGGWRHPLHATNDEPHRPDGQARRDDAEAHRRSVRVR
eukprot:CAMPEP_0197426970 /NCGR_PEP_ID=MMETSP1170-20131217/36835_1 /TAXON_ID=54406 /ORGANISM="Sarcinochrysis sp, Strain CCMP770" /LENGTH=280 /DNA_ID=CAMNT_0042954647 /DNA_START=118 /DNA_END=957 /DNA_ORIENTATION=-